MTGVMRFLYVNFIQTLWHFFRELGALTIFAESAVRSFFLPPYRRTITRAQMDSIGVGSFPIVVLTGIFMGLVLAMQSIVELKAFGATSYLGRPIGTTVVRELGPVLTSIMIAARAGSAAAAELASMVIGEQVDAMRAEGSDPIRKLVEPRIAAFTLMMPLLTVICIAVAFVGGWIVAVNIVQVSTDFYWQSILEVLTPAFIWGGVIKALAFGFITGVIATYSGMKTSSSATGVGEATTKAVVYSCISILALDFLLTKIYIMTWW